MSDRHSKKPYSLRIDDELRQKVENAAKGNGRSVNSEMTARLQDSFENRSDDVFSPHMRRRLEEIAQERGMSFAEALSRTLQAGLEPDAPFVAYIRVDSKMTMADLHKVFEAAKQHVPKDATVVLESDAA